MTVSDELRCAYCRGPATSVDHVWSRSRGGSDHPNNLVPACRTCNATKGTRSLLDDCCMGCWEVRTPGDVNCETGEAWYTCRCGCSWRMWWALQYVPLMTG